jgi:putative heme-binding domain-containing protein
MYELLKKSRLHRHLPPACAYVLIPALLAFVSSPVLAVQVRNPFAANHSAAKAGEFEFHINCAFCHGLGARGGGRGPDLTRAHLTHGDSDADLFRNINQGIPGTAMPANGTNGQGVGMTDEEIWQIITYLRSIQIKAPTKAIGNAQHGKQLFYGDARCSSCHMVDGKGGRLGPDLSSVAITRTMDSLIESVRRPSRRLAWGLTEPTKEFAQEYETATVVTSDGQQITGVTLNEDQFSIQIMDMTEHIHSFQKNDLRSCKTSRQSLMPQYPPTMLSDQELRDIIAYLFSAAAK